MLKYSKTDYELIVTAQKDLGIVPKDSRLKIVVGNSENRQDLYSGYDAMVLPRRYAGLCLPMNEALISGLPVFMTTYLQTTQYFLKNGLRHHKNMMSLRQEQLLMFTMLIQNI
jgi:glycosyltransferase involved in cell wall biosynthesis